MYVSNPSLNKRERKGSVAALLVCLAVALSMPSVQVRTTENYDTSEGDNHGSDVLTFKMAALLDRFWRGSGSLRLRCCRGMHNYQAQDGAG
jgi:hypothetical protein